MTTERNTQATEATETVTRTVGECQWCGGTFKAPGGAVVFHGYTRPGTGRTHGRCPGTEHPAYELSCALLVHALPGLHEGVASLRTALVEAETATYFEMFYTAGFGHSAKLRTATYSATVTSPELWERKFAANKREIKATLDSAVAHCAWVEQRIAAWTLRDLRTVDEHGLTEAERASKAAAAQERAAKRAAKDEKAAALQAKRDASKAARTARLAEVAAELVRLAAAPGPDATNAARDLLDGLNKPKWRKVVGQWWEWDLCQADGVADALMALGVGEQYGNGRVGVKL